MRLCINILHSVLYIWWTRSIGLRPFSRNRSLLCHFFVHIATREDWRATEYFQAKWYVFLTAGMPFLAVKQLLQSIDSGESQSHPTISVRTLKGTQSTNPNQPPGLILSSSTAGCPTEGTLLSDASTNVNFCSSVFTAARGHGIITMLCFSVYIVSYLCQ